MDKKETENQKAESIEEEIEEFKTAGGFLALVRGNNLTLNDYLQMMNSGLNDDLDEDENDPDIEEYKNAQNRNSGNTDNLSDDSAD